MCSRCEHVVFCLSADALSLIHAKQRCQPVKTNAGGQKYIYLRSFHASMFTHKQAYNEIEGRGKFGCRTRTGNSAE